MRSLGAWGGNSETYSLRIKSVEVAARGWIRLRRDFIVRRFNDSTHLDDMYA